MSEKSTHEPVNLEQPFPLRRLFQRRFMPMAVLFLLLSVLLIGMTAREIVGSIYLELAQRRAQTIARAVEDAAPTAWRSLMARQTAEELSHLADASLLLRAFSDEVKELNLPELKVYDLEKKVLFATNTSEIGTTEDGPALISVIDNAAPEIVTKDLADGAQQYELYVPVFDTENTLRAVFELYEPVGYLDKIFARTIIPSVAVPLVLLLGLFWVLNRLVGRAQSDIDARTGALNELRRRLESFVSKSAANAARGTGQHGEITSQNVITTLFFSDIRDFTGFSEQNTPEDVVDFLNELMSLQVRILRAHGGDIDKMIGDAILARFDGDDGAKNALRAAEEILTTMGRFNFPRALGIGVYRGSVISGAIGPEDRRDFTVIGDSVNVAARLCSAAEAREIVVDASLTEENFGPLEKLTVKGRTAPLVIRRKHIPTKTASPER
ncbi:adenylate/guanylate cyclase domain-containing protein [Thalassospira sp.]|uniref:adenylate/guanylate cyclase domain-containing protein n=1 Tax=Thalassospira sp. TaxID=1912094 RepID=UPI000C40FC96|nr:adenylate/guanylate cyclase domain-containing protein [Thalassospira sp.]MBC05029.1 adenylate cyclase [Thalassospira sp.]|tara:strand:- start:7225 stop:8544 length:1320 start_codon:yes stop_codon:yes gene_type:complete